MQSLGEKLTDNELDEMVAEADSDKDGLINYQGIVFIFTSNFIQQQNIMNSRAKLSFFLTSKYSLPFEEFVHVLCCEGVGEGNRKKTGAKKNKRDRKTREKGKENKENQQRIDDGLLTDEKTKEVCK